MLGKCQAQTRIHLCHTPLSIPHTYTHSAVQHKLVAGAAKIRRKATSGPGGPHLAMAVRTLWNSACNGSLKEWKRYGSIPLLLLRLAAVSSGVSAARRAPSAISLTAPPRLGFSVSYFVYIHEHTHTCTHKFLCTWYNYVHIQV